MKRLAGFLFIALSAFAVTTPTTVVGTVKLPNGAGLTGKVYITWTRFTAVGGEIIPTPKTPLEVAVTNGTFTVNLIPNDTALPAGGGYTVWYSFYPGQTETWTVPTSLTSVNASDIATTNIVDPSFIVALGQLASGGATTGQCMIWDGYWQAGACGTGSVTSAALSMPAIFSVSGSPITGSGTFTVTAATQSANKVWAGPATGADAAPTFRSLAAADVTGTVTGTPTGSKYLRDDWSWQAFGTCKYGPQSITVTTGSYAIPQITHGITFKYPLVFVWLSGEAVLVKDVLDNPGTDADITLTLANGTYVVLIFDPSCIGGGGGGGGTTDHAALSNLGYTASGHGSEFVGASGLAPTDNYVVLGNGSIWVPATLPSCSNSTSSKLLYNNSTHTFSCGTDQNSGGGTTYGPDGTGLVTFDTGVTPVAVGLDATVMRSDTTQNITGLHSYLGGLWEPTHKTVATLPTCSTTKWLIFVTDATSASDCSTGSSTGHVAMCYCDGSGGKHAMGGY